MHIGQLVQIVAKARGMSHAAVGAGINKVPSSVTHMLKKESIDTALLQRLGELMDFNFLEVLANPDLYDERIRALTDEQYNLTPDTKNKAKETQPLYGLQKVQGIPVMVQLDGTAETLDIWIDRLRAINQAV